MNGNLEDSYHVDWWLKDQSVDLRQYDISVQRSVEKFKAIYLKTCGDAKAGLSDMIELWANGATDHFYDMRVPKEWENTKLAKKVTEHLLDQIVVVIPISKFKELLDAWKQLHVEYVKKLKVMLNDKRENSEAQKL